MATVPPHSKYTKEHEAFEEAAAVVREAANIEALSTLTSHQIAESELQTATRVLIETAEAMNSMKSAQHDFVANISHELRTPMTVIKGYVGSIIDGVIPPEQYPHYLAQVSDGIVRMEKIIAVMREVSRYSAREVKLNISEVNVLDVLRKTMYSFEFAISEKNVTLNIKGDSNLTINADLEQFTILIKQLVDNAVKFVNTNGCIDINVVDENNKMTLKVRNSGSYLSDTSRIFDSFYKIDDSRGLDPLGVGAGLFFVKAIAELHGGKVRAVTSLEEPIFAELIAELPHIHV
jgi:signal transduction histidine kinase